MKKPINYLLAILLLSSLSVLFAQNKTDSGSSARDPQGDIRPVYFVPAEATASGFFVENETKYFRYHPWMAFDDNPLTSWNEDAEGFGKNEYLKIEFSQPVLIDKIEIMPGFFDANWYKANNRIKECKIYFDSLSTTCFFEDVMAAQIIPFPNTVRFTTMTIYIQSVYRGEKYDDTCISEIMFYYQGKRIKIDNESILKRIKEAAGKPVLASPPEMYCLVNAMYGSAAEYFFRDGTYIKVRDAWTEEEGFTIKKGTWSAGPGGVQISVSVDHIYAAVGRGNSLTWHLGIMFYEDYRIEDKKADEHFTVNWAEYIKNTKEKLAGENYEINIITPFHYDKFKGGCRILVEDYIRKKKAKYGEIKSLSEK